MSEENRIEMTDEEKIIEIGIEILNNKKTLEGMPLYRTICVCEGNGKGYKRSDLSML